MPFKLHLDTDIGGDTDDLCALALLLAVSGVELTGITTSTDPGGQRAGLAAHALALAGRTDIPVAAGAGGTLAPGYLRAELPDTVRYWGTAIAARPGPPGAAMDLLAHSIDAGAAVLVIGPWTNLALLETARPGSLAETHIVCQGGAVSPARPGYLAAGPEMDYNVRQDTAAARIVLERAGPTLALAQTPVALEACLRASDLPRLRAAGQLARLLAWQAQRYHEDDAGAAAGAGCPSLPDDLLNFQADAVAAALALGWDCLSVEETPLVAEPHGDLLVLRPNPAGRPVQLLTAINAPAFARRWLATVAGNG